MRINGFEQIKAFYSWVFENQDKHIRTSHISLYMFLLNQNNRNNWVEWFKCPFDLAMCGSGITNKKTYYNTLLELQDFNLITYKKGVNNYKAPLIRIEVLFDTSTVPQCEPQLQPQVIPLTEPLLQPQMVPNIKLLTNNIQLITLNIKEILQFLSRGDKKDGKFNFKKSLVDLGFNEDLVKDWLIVRKNKKATNSETAFKTIKNEVEKTDFDINEILKMHVERSWSGFKVLWYSDEIEKDNKLKTNLNGKEPTINRQTESTIRSNSEGW